MFQKATRKKAFLKLGITGPSGGGKTYSALRLATGLAETGRVAFLDTENKSASLYSDKFNFDVLDIAPPYLESKFVDGINEAVSNCYNVAIVDSASHFWQGILDVKAGMDARGGNSYTNWNQAGSKYNEVLTAILQSPIHLICCLRSKMEYVLETNDKGKQAPRKVGLAPIMRDGVEYEFTTVFDCDKGIATASKDRSGLFKDETFRITEDTGRKFLAWLNSAKFEADPTISTAITEDQRLVELYRSTFKDLEPELHAFLVSKGYIIESQLCADLSLDRIKRLMVPMTLESVLSKLNEPANTSGSL